MKQILKIILFFIFFNIFAFANSVYEHEMRKDVLEKKKRTLLAEREKTSLSSRKDRINSKIKEIDSRISYLDANANNSAEEILEAKASNYNDARTEYEQFLKNNPKTQENSETFKLSDGEEYTAYKDENLNKQFTSLKSKIDNSKHELVKAKADYLYQTEGGYQNHYGLPLSKKEVAELNSKKLNPDDLQANLDYVDSVLSQNSIDVKNGTFETESGLSLSDAINKADKNLLELEETKELLEKTDDPLQREFLRQKRDEHEKLNDKYNDLIVDIQRDYLEKNPNTTVSEIPSDLKFNKAFLDELNNISKSHDSLNRLSEDKLEKVKNDVKFKNETPKEREERINQAYESAYTQASEKQAQEAIKKEEEENAKEQSKVVSSSTTTSVVPEAVEDENVVSSHTYGKVVKTKKPAESLYVKEGYTYNPESATIACEEYKEGYFARPSAVNYEKGLINCDVYSVDEPYQVLETRVLFNALLKEKYKYNPPKKVKGESLYIDERLDELSQKYFIDFVNTGGVTYLTTPEFLLAVLTADTEVIDLRATLEDNKVVLKPEFTIYPNDTVGYERTFLNSMYSVFQQITNNVYNTFANLTGNTQAYRNHVHPPDIIDDRLLSSSSEILSSIAVWWLDFLTESNNVYQWANMVIVMVLLPFSAIVMTGESYTQKLSGMRPQNNYIGAGVISTLVFLTMFSSYEKTELYEKDIFNGDKVLEQSFYQESSRTIIGYGIQIANAFSNVYNKTLTDYNAKSASINPDSSIKERTNRIAQLEKIDKAHDSYIARCEQTYDTDTLKSVVSNLYNITLAYPPSAKSGTTNFYSYLKNPQDLIANNTVDVVSCYTAVRQKDLNLKRIAHLQKENEHAKVAVEKGMIDRIANIAEIQYKNSAEMGFFSVITATTMTTSLANLDDFRHFTDDLDKKRDYIEEQVQRTLGNQNVAVSDVLEMDYIEVFPKSMAYFSLPWFGDIYNGVSYLEGLGSDRISKAVNTKKDKLEKNENEKSNSLLSNYGGKKREMGKERTSGYIGIVANFIMDLIANHPWVSFFKALLEMGITGIKLAIAIYFYNYFLDILVPFAVLSAGMMAILFWIAEIVIYYLVTPFMFAYALLKSQGHAVGKFLARGLIIASRPTLLVFSVAVAVLLNGMYESISTFIITKNFASLFGVNELGMIDTFVGLMQQSFYELAIKFIIPFIMFFIVLTGALMFVKQFGYSDEADFGQQLTSSIESRGGNYNMPV